MPGTRVLRINDVDRHMRKPVIELNKKCYYTRATCQGHRGIKPAYIMFDGWVSFPVAPPDFGTETRRSRTKNAGKFTSVRWWDSIDPGTSQKEFNDAVLGWARQLPSACNRRKVKMDVLVDLGDGKEPLPLSTF